MKNQEKLMPEQLFYQSNLTKSQIADCIGINRRTLTTWINDNQWDRIRTSAQHMPALIAENLYIAMAHLTNNILSVDRVNKPITDTESKILHRMILDINKLKNRATLNENLEMMRYFMEFVQSKDPEAVDLIQPFVQEYIKSRARVQPGRFMPPDFNDDGLRTPKEENFEELHKDIEERLNPVEVPDPYETDNESVNKPPITTVGPGFIPNTRPSPSLKSGASNTLYHTTGTLEPDGQIEEPKDENYINDLIAKKQGNLNRAARRKLAKNQQKQKNTCSNK